MKTSILLASAGALIASAMAGEGVSYKIHGQAWTQAGRIMQASDTALYDGNTTLDVNGTTMQSLGGQVRIDADLGERWKGAFGIGVYQISHSLGSLNGSTEYPNFFSVSMFRPFIAQANLTYSVGDVARPWLSITAGNFAYNYNPDVKDLGLYLLRGPVYPGILMSGFQEFDTDTTKGAQTGFKVHNDFGKFSQDLLFLNEQSLPPTFDWSLAYVAKYQASKALTVGAGVNFYRLIPYSAQLETPGHLPLAAQDGAPNFDTTGVGAGGDTVFYTHQGVKVMAMFTLDPKPWLPFSHMGAEDFKVYGEGAIIGVQNYGSFYDDVFERIPLMVGFNVPTFGFLDMLSLEMEWYGSPYKNDLGHIGYPSNVVAPWQNPGFGTPSPTPAMAGSYPDSTADNLKWAVFVQKTVSKHVRFTVQIANDHYRPTPLSKDFTNSAGGTLAVLSRPGDWYFMGRIGFFF